MSDNAKQSPLEPYLIEYRLAAERYENIYKAIWQNFSYMAALSAGILAFGEKALPERALYVGAIVPMLFWYLATYIPMDHYAREARRRAAQVEALINSLTGAQLAHYTEFGRADPRVHVGKGAPLPFFHVNHIVHFVGVSLIVASTAITIRSIRSDWGRRIDAANETKVSDFDRGMMLQLDSVNVRLGLLQRSFAGTDSLTRCIAARQRRAKSAC